MIKSCCGFDCGLCPLYLATISEDDNQVLDVVSKYSLKTKETCLGCLSNECASMCQKCNIKSCCLSKKIENCGQCIEYKTCKKIGYIISTNTKSKEYLDNENMIFLSNKSSN